MKYGEHKDFFDDEAFISIICRASESPPPTETLSVSFFLELQESVDKSNWIKVKQLLESEWRKTAERVDQVHCALPKYYSLQTY